MINRRELLKLGSGGVATLVFSRVVAACVGDPPQDVDPKYYPPTDCTDAGSPPPPPPTGTGTGTGAPPPPPPTGTGTGTPPSPQSVCADGTAGDGSTSSVNAGHVHYLCVPATDLTNPPAAGVTYDSTIVDSHLHTVTFTQAMLATIAKGGSVSVVASNVAGHIHTFVVHN